MMKYDILIVDKNDLGFAVLETRFLWGFRLRYNLVCE